MLHLLDQNMLIVAVSIMFVVFFDSPTATDLVPKVLNRIAGLRLLFSTGFVWSLRFSYFSIFLFQLSNCRFFIIKIIIL